MTYLCISQKYINAVLPEEGTVVTFEKQVGNNGKQSACNLALG